MPHLRNCEIEPGSPACDLNIDYGSTNKASLIEGLFPIGALLSGQVLIVDESKPRSHVNWLGNPNTLVLNPCQPALNLVNTKMFTVSLFHA